MLKILFHLYYLYKYSCQVLCVYFVPDSVSSLCPTRTDLVFGQTEYDVTSSSTFRPWRVLKGTKNTVKSRSGKDLDFMVTGMCMGD